MSATAQRSDEGMTLIELLVYMVFAVVIVVLGGGMLINSLRVEDDVDALSTAANDGQLAVRSIETGIRNASDFTATAVTNPAGQLLRARTADVEGGTFTWQCEAWFYSSDSGTIRYRASSAGAVAVPDAEQLRDWMLLADDVGTEDALALPFVKDGGALRLNYQVDADGAPVAITTTITAGTFPDAQRTVSPASCF